MSLDYTMLYRRRLTLEQIAGESRKWSKFVSGWNPTHRVRKVYDAVDLPLDEKLWVVQPEYRYEPDELPPEPHVQPRSGNEAELWDECLEEILGGAADGRLCVDLTGLMRPHLIYLVGTLFDHGVDRFFALYTDPLRYKAAENTKFSQGPVSAVRQIAGFEGLHEADTSNDLLVIGMGYEDELIRHVASDKNHAKKVPLFGLPSLQPDMYQQSVLRTEKASEALSAVNVSDIAFAPANDPFATAQTLREIVDREQATRPITNLYLASLGTKPQALGFALYYIAEQRDRPASILFPYAESYARETAEGLARSWLYEVRVTSG